jgi:ribosomal protein L40E
MAEKDLGYVELEWTCPSCNARNPGSATKCNQCGAPMPADTKFELGAEEQLVTDKDKVAAAQAAPDIYCAYCGTRNASTAKVCRQCGAALGEGKAREAGGIVGTFSGKPAPPLICPSCGAENKATALKCVKCGAVLGKPAAAAPEAAAGPARRGRGWVLPLILVGIALLVGLFLLIRTGTRTTATIGQIADYGWRRSIAVEVLAPVEREAWRDQLPAGVDPLSCQKRVSQVVDQPVAGAREVCGTPYIKDTGTGYGKKVQDCRYEVLEDYCRYRATAWVAAAPIVLEGSDLNPRWPSARLDSNQRAGGQSEEYYVVFRANDREYRYTPRTVDEYLRLAGGGPWKLTINGFGQIASIEPG